MTALNVPIQQHRGTASSWVANNPTLLAGELGVETNTGKVKVGDGVTAWNDLGYIAGEGGGTAALTDAVEVPIVAGVADVAAAINAGAFTAQVMVTAETTVEIVLPDPAATPGGWVLVWIDLTGACAITYSGGGYTESLAPVDVSSGSTVFYMWHMEPFINGSPPAVWAGTPMFGGDQLGGGSGDVVGPASATDGRAVLFDGTTGKLIKAATAAPMLVGDAPTAHAHSGSDITSGTVATARLDVGTTTGKVAAGDDGRFTDARTPNVAGSDDDIMQRKAGAWTYRTPAQVAADLTTLAPLASPTFTGTPAAPTATAGTSTTQLATTAFVAASAAVNAAPPYPTESGSYVANIASNGGSTVGILAASGRMVLALPLWLGTGTYDRLELYTTANAVATWRVGLVPSISTGPDWAHAVDYGTLNMNATAGAQAITITSPGSGWWYPVILVDSYTANPSVHQYSNSTAGAGSVRGFPESQTGARTVALYWTGVATGAIPTSSPGAPTLTTVGPVVRVRKA